MYIERLKKSFIYNLKNIPGWSTKRKIVAFISDDWGDLRVRSEEDYQKLIENGIPVDRSPHTRIETCATYDDLNRLFEVLTSVRDKNGDHAVLSPFTIMVNPDFKKIRESNFEQYHYKLFTKTIEESENGSKTLQAWQTGIENKLFIPELHGREHINVPVWMRKLQTGNEIYHLCFDHHFAHYTSPEMATPIVAAYNFQTEDDFIFIDEALRDAIDLFGKVFRRQPAVFNPPNAIFHSRFYQSLISKGITNIDTPHYRLEPNGEKRLEKKRYRFGDVSAEGMVHSISNCAFEPIKGDKSVVENTLGQVEAAFRWNKPALINTHRINYVKGRGGSHTDSNLRALSILLKEIVKRWPDVEFMSVGKFAKYLNSTVLNNKVYG